MTLGRFRIISNLNVKKELAMGFFHKKYKYRTQTMNFSSGNLELFKMALDQNHNTPSDYQQSLCKVELSDIFP